MLSKKITKQELLIVAAARQIANGDVVALGVGMPILAGAVAKHTHAPDCVLMMESGIVDFEPRVLPINVADATCTRGYGYAIDLFSVFTTIGYAGYLDKAFLGVGQIDKYGNVNSTYLGKPPYCQRITAAGGAPEFGGYARETILTMTGPGFVETLPYVSTPGWLSGGDEREKSGRYTPGSGPSMLLTPKAIFRFDPVTKEMYLNALIPGISVEEVKAEVPWDLKIAAELKSFPIPTDEEIAFLRKLSPCNSFANSTATALRTEYIEKKRKVSSGQ